MCVYTYITGSQRNNAYAQMISLDDSQARAICAPDNTRHASNKERERYVGTSPNLPTNIVDFRGFDSSIILILRGGILMSIGDSPESLSQAILVLVMLVGGLGVFAKRFGRTCRYELVLCLSASCCLDMHAHELDRYIL